MYRFLIKVQNAQERTKLYPLLKPHNKLNSRKKSLLGGLYTRRGSGGGGGALIIRVFFCLQVDGPIPGGGSLVGGRLKAAAYGISVT